VLESDVSMLLLCARLECVEGKESFHRVLWL
jgi:hypothetical protein